MAQYNNNNVIQGQLHITGSKLMQRSPNWSAKPKTLGLLKNPKVPIGKMNLNLFVSYIFLQ